MSKRKPLPGVVKLLLCLGGIWFFLWVFTPFWVSFSPVHQEFEAVQEKYDIPIKALYYNDLPFINDAQIELRDTWRFPPKGPKPDAETANK